MIMPMTNKAQDKIWNALYRQIRRLFASKGVESATGDGDYWVVDDNYGWRRQYIYIFNLELLTPSIIHLLRKLLNDLYDWEIVLVVDVVAKEDEWPPMGITIRMREIIDGLQREYLPQPYRNIHIAGSRPGTGYD